MHGEDTSAQLTVWLFYMANLVRFGRRLFRRPSYPRQPSNASFSVLSGTAKVEEEKLPWYSPVQFYQTHIGEVFNSRYQVVGKLGYGSSSTAWLCRDLTYLLFHEPQNNKTNWPIENINMLHWRYTNIAPFKQVAKSKSMNTSMQWLQVI